MNSAPPKSARQRGASRAPFPADLVLAPVSRRPTRLEDATLKAILERDVPAYGTPAGPPKASVVVATRDNLPFLRLCLESVLFATELPVELIVIDNGSSDSTADYLDRLSAENPAVRPVRNKTNSSFAKACNQGAALAEGDLLLLLNDDTAVTPGWLPRLVAHLDGSEVGMIGPVTNRTGNEAQIDASYRTWGEFGRFADARAREHAGAAFEIETLTMFCVAMRRALYDEIGSLDERFETGLLEDDDYSRRVRAAGYRLLCADDAYVHHFGETSFGKLVPSGEYGRVLEANRARFEDKWGTPWHPYERRPSGRYREQSARMRRAVAEVADGGATVLVVSRGDDELLRIDGMRTRHFPAGRGGEYAGHHPADSEEAIAWLEEQRDAGADLIVFPATASWWLEHYEELRRHLERTCKRIHSEPETCVIFDLGGAAR